MATAPAPVREPFASLDELILAMYRAVSGADGLDMDLQRSVFSTDARLMRTGIDAAGQHWRQVMTIEDYYEDTQAFFRTQPFHEYEVSRSEFHCLPYAQVLSQYEARRSPNDDEILLRGYNSLHCYFDDARWWIVNLTWARTTADGQPDCAAAPRRRV